MAAHYTEVEIAKFNKILNRLSDSSMIDLSRFDLIVYGGGGQNTKFYDDLKEDPDLEVMWSGWGGPKWLSFLSFYPGYAGLIKVLNPLRLRPLFEELGAMSSSEIYYIPQEVTQNIVERICKRDAKAFDLLKEHPEFLYMKAQLDDYVQHDAECYYLYDYKLGPETAAVIRTVFVGL